MAFADFSSSDLKEQQLPHGLLDIHGKDLDRNLAGRNHAAAGYRIRLAFLIVATFVLWGAIFETARLIFRA
jgi:hypothetical protein